LPGGHRVYTVLERELILDINTIRSALYDMGEKVNIDINYEEATVKINKKED